MADYVFYDPEVLKAEYERGWQCAVTAFKETQTEVARLESDLAKIHDALRPFIAGGSEYSGVSGDLRAIQEIGERGNRATERSLRLTGEMKELKAEIERLQKQNSALSNALVNSSRVYDKLYREFGKLADAASDVYDFHFDDDHSVFLRRLRRVMKACGIYFCRK